MIGYSCTYHNTQCYIFKSFNGQQTEKKKKSISFLTKGPRRTNSKLGPFYLELYNTLEKQIKLLQTPPGPQLVQTK